MGKVSYLDTNIFIYLSDKLSLYNKSCTSFIKHCENNNISIVTSTETIQEIIHYAKNTNQLELGLNVASNVLELVDNLYPVTPETIKHYLKYAEMYKGVESRDLIHLSVCMENKLNTIITYDKKFKSFRGVKVLRPEEVL